MLWQYPTMVPWFLHTHQALGTFLDRPRFQGATSILSFNSTETLNDMSLGQRKKTKARLLEGLSFGLLILWRGLCLSPGSKLA